MDDTSSDASATVGNPSDGWTVVDPAALGSGDGNGGSGAGVTGRRGRKPGSRNAPKDETATLAGSLDLTSILLSIHTFAAIRLQAPSLELTEPDAKKIQKAIRLVEKHHKVSMSQKHADYAMAAWILLEVYGPRVVSVYTDKKAERAKPAVVAASHEQGPEVLPFLRPQG